MEVQLVVGERRMDGRQEKDDIQVGLEDEIEQEGLAPEQGHEKQERCRARHGDGQQGLKRQHEQRSAAVGSRGRGVCDHRRGVPGHGCGVHGTVVMFMAIEQSTLGSHGSAQGEFRNIYIYITVMMRFLSWILSLCVGATSETMALESVLEVPTATS